MSDEAQAPVAENVADTATNETTTTTTEAPSSALREALSSHLGEGAEAPAWMGKYADDASLANGIFSGQSMIGKKGDIPSEGSTPETYNEFADKLGFQQPSEAQTYVSLESERFGDNTETLNGVYNEGISSVMEKAIENFRANPSPQAFADALSEWANGDAEATLISQTEGSQQLTEQFNATALKVGLSPEQLTEQNSEAVKRFGFNDDTTIHEILYTLAKNTSNSTTIQDAHMNNTSEGLQNQVDALAVELNNASVPPDQHAINLKKMNELIGRQADLAKRTSN